jgi:GNAT superfamily N-acetyltransferase
MSAIRIAIASPQDKSEIADLYSASYGTLLKADYPPDVLQRALPLLARVNDDLVGSGTYYVARDGEGRLIGAGGWTCAEPGTGRLTPGHAHIRHFAVDPAAGRRGVGRRLFERCVEAAGSGIVFECFSTRTAVAFYRSLGFEPLEEVVIAMAPEVGFPSVRMIRAPRNADTDEPRTG